MQGKNVIEVKNVEKAFKVFYDRGKSLKEVLTTPGRRKYENREVLKGISFSVKKGEAIGLIGKNGCGKSTTLKLLTKIIYPDKGTISIKGRVSSLLELGAGFHPDMSGRENIYLNAAVFGLTRKEIDKRVEEIIAFSELEEFIENPVRTYSSGMYMRLAFAVAINVEADVLLIDEILAVGDVSFQTKCFEKLQEIKALGTTIVIVSHSLGQLERICDRCIWVCDGLIKEEGKPKEVNAHYYKEMEEQRLQRCREEETKRKEESLIEDEKTGELNRIIENNLEEEKNVTEKKRMPEFLDKMATRVGSGEGEFSGLSLRSMESGDGLVFSMNDTMEVAVTMRAKKELEDMSVSVSITREDGVYCYGTNTKYDECVGIDFGNEEKRIVFYLDNIQLLQGKYYINLGLYDKHYNEYDVIWNAKKFYVKSDDPNGEIGVMHMEHHWSY